MPNSTGRRGALGRVGARRCALMSIGAAQCQASRGGWGLGQGRHSVALEPCMRMWPDLAAAPAFYLPDDGAATRVLPSTHHL